MISIIAAVGKNYELGKNNNLIWHLKEDLINFKKMTMGKKIVMGANTYKSLPKNLEGREYIVLSKSLKDIKNGILFTEFAKLLDYLNSLDEEVMIIGGASIYQQFLPFADKIYLTEVAAVAPADVYFPAFDKSKYQKNVIKKLKENDIEYEIIEYVR